MQRDLVAQAQHGDVGAFSALTAARFDRLFGAARLILRDNEQAADAVQDALLAAWLDLRALRDPERFDAWLHRLLVRACYRAAGRRRTRELAELAVTVRGEPSVPDEQHALAARDQMSRAFRRLTAEQRTVIVLHHYLGLSMAEAADALGAPIGTVQSRLHRATQAMRAAIEADDRLPVLAGGITR